MPQEKEAESDDYQSCGKCAECRGARARCIHRAMISTSNAQRPTPNAQSRKSQRHFAFLSAARTLEKKNLMSSSVSLRIAAIFGAGIIDDLATSRNGEVAQRRS